VPDICRIGPTSSTGVNLIDLTRYRFPADRYSLSPQITETMNPANCGGTPILSRYNVDWLTRTFDIECIRSGYQNKLTDLAAIQTQINNAIAYTLSNSGSQIFFFEQYDDQATVLSYPILKGHCFEEKRTGGGIRLRVTAHIVIDCMASVT